MKDLKERTLKGALVRVCAQVANFALRIGSLMILARLLDPKDFGLVGMVTAVTGVFGLFRDAGLSMVTVQRPTISNEQVSALFWLNVLAGMVLASLCVGLAPLLVTFYHEPRLFWVTAVLATGFLFNAVGVQHSALLERNLQFGSLSAIEIASQAVSALIGIGLAMHNFGYWSLVVSAVVLPAMYTLGVWLVSGWIPRVPQWEANLGSMVRFGGLATFNSLVMYVSYNLEKVLLGRFWGAEALGLYGRAYQLINIPTETLNSASGGVAFAALSRIQGEPIRLRDYFLKGYSAILALTLPLTIGCALFAGDIILILLGQKWRDVVPIFQLLTPTILIFAVINPLAWLLFSMGMLGRSLKVALVLSPLVMGSYILGLQYGPKGVALAYSAVMTLWLIPHIMWCVHGTMISLQDILKAASRPFISATAAGAVAFTAQFFYGVLFPPIPRLLLGGGILVIVYVWMLLYVMGQKAFYMDLFHTMRQSSINHKRLIAAL